MNSIAIAGDYLYFVQSDFHILDISDPTTPVEVGRTPSVGRSTSLTVAEDHAFLTAGSYGLFIFDVSNPHSPREVGEYDVIGSNGFQDVSVSGSTAYVADLDWGMRIIDVSDPTSPTEIGGYASWFAHGVAAFGDFVVLADLFEGTRLIDVSDPSQLVETAFVMTPGYARSVSLDGEHVVVACWEAGLLIPSGTFLSAESAVAVYDPSGNSRTPARFAICQLL